MVAPRQELESKGINKATQRVLMVLESFVGQTEPLGASELSRRLDMSRNMVHRALVTLAEEGLLHKHGDTGRYHLSYNLARLQNTEVPAPDFRTIARPFLEELKELTGETVILSIRSGDVQVVLDGIEGDGSVALRVKLGRALPLHVSVASRAILAAMSDEDVEDYLSRNAPLRAYTDKTLTRPAAIRKEVAQVREVGHAISFGDFNQSTAAIGFALPDVYGKPHGAVVVGGPVERLPRDWEDSLLPGMREIVDRLRTIAALYEAL
ncbi:IclR family transcriptional regulator [Mameliella alba]|nr:IclR family transcriptional regulator [Antarctobacter heliothermus]MBY6144455.1 IclR family transcriptional regulator [Mameliella alba]MCA0954504.1 IclR family transcriptional regulator [Mameliella alba]